MQNLDRKAFFRFKKETFWTTYGIPLALIVLCICLGFTTKAFATVDNWLNILRQISILTIAAMGTTLILISGGMDISMGAVMALSGIVSVALIVNYNVSFVVAIAAAMLVGCLLGLTNGLLITAVRIPPFIATLATMQMCRGIGFVYTGGYSLYGDNIPKAFSDIGRGYLGGIPIPVIIMVGIVAIFFIIANYTKLGTYAYAIGCNEKASRLSGINVRKIKILLYIIGGLMSAVAGIVITARLNSAQAAAAQGFEFDILTAIVLGGTSIYGGKGKIQRTMLGAVMMGVIDNGMTLLNVNTFYKMIANGAILALALSMDRINSKE